MNRLFGFGVVVWLMAFAVLAAEPQLVVKGLKGAIEDGKAFASFSVFPTSGYISDFLTAESGISRFTDNLGNDLGAKPVDKRPDYTTMPYYTGVSKSGGEKEHTIGVASSLKVSPAVRSFTLAGELRVKIADSDRTNEIKNLVISEGGTLLVGQHQGKIVSVNKSAGKFDFVISFTNVTEDIQLRDIELFNAAGEKIRKNSNTMWARFGDGPGKYELQFYGIKGDPGPVTLKCSQWVGVREVRTPFSFTVLVDGGGQIAQASPVAGGLAPVGKAPEAVVKAGAQLSKAPPPVAPLGPVQGAWPLLKVAGVMGRGQGATVIINGKMLNPGESISGVRVEMIANGAVVLSWQGESKRLRTGQSTQ